MKQKANPGFAAYVVEVLSRVPQMSAVSSRPMFGGHNVSLEGLTFGLIAYDVLYLKVDDENRPSFEKAGLGPFVYKAKGGKEMAMSYHAAPDCLDDPDDLEPWVKGALAAAQRAKAPKKPVSKKKTAATSLPKKVTAKARSTKIATKKAAPKKGKLPSKSPKQAKGARS